MNLSPRKVMEDPRVKVTFTVIVLSFAKHEYIMQLCQSHFGPQRVIVNVVIMAISIVLYPLKYLI